MARHEAVDPHRPNALMVAPRLQFDAPARSISRDRSGIKRLGQFAQENLKVAQAPPVRHSDLRDKGSHPVARARCPSSLTLAQQAPTRSSPAPAAQRVDKKCREAPTEPPPPRGNARALPTCRHHGSVAPIKR